MKEICVCTLDTITEIGRTNIVTVLEDQSMEGVVQMTF
jgi:hypothetical protein